MHHFSSRLRPQKPCLYTHIVLEITMKNNKLFIHVNIKWYFYFDNWERGYLNS